MRSLLFILFTCLSLGLFGQDFNRVHFTTVNGLPDNSVSSVLQDSRGFMWFGTREGLSRYDGTTFRNYGGQKSDSMSLTGYVSDLYQTKPGNLIFSSEYRLVGLNTYHHTFYRPSSFINRYVFSIRKVNADRYLVGSVDTCFVADANMNVVGMLIPPFKQSNQWATGFPLTENLYLIGNAHNYFLYDLNSKTFTAFDLGMNSAPPTSRFDFAYFDPKQKWVYVINSFTDLQRHSLTGTLLKSWTFYHGTSVISINDSLLWLGAGYEKLGSKLLSVQNDSVIPLLVNGKVSYDAYTLQNDNEGNHWLGSSEGVTKIQFKSQFIKSWSTFDGKLPHHVPLNIVKGKDQHMYLSMYITPNLYRLNEKTDDWELITNKLNTGSWCMNNVGDEIIFTGGRTTRFTTYNPVTGKLSTSTDFLKPYFPNSDIVILAFQHSNGDRWYSGNKGGGFVRVTDGKIHHYTQNGPRGSFTWSYYSNYAEDRQGDLWFGVNKSPFLLHWSKGKNQFSEIKFNTLKDMEGKIFRGINKLVTDREGNLWIGFDGSGLVRYTPKNNSTIHYTTEDGLPSNYVTNLAFDSRNRLWIATPKGLNCLSVDENSFRTFTVEEGLADDQFTEGFLYYDSATNKLWAGATTAITAFNTDSLLMKTRQPINVYVDEILVSGQKYVYEPGQLIQLSPYENNVQFRFVGVHNNGKKIVYGYQLSGYDNDWVENFSGTSVAYANLEPGNYTFSVRAKYKGDKEWFIIGNPLYVSIATPWFKAWWFRLGLTVGSIFSVVLLIRMYYTRKNEKQRLILEKQQAVEKERTRIATDMHDDFGASLSRIKFISEKMKLTTRGDSKIESDLTKISGYSDQMAEKMNEIVWALNNRYDSLEDLISFSRAYVADYLLQHDIQLSFSAEIDTNRKISGEVRRNVFLVIKESLHNVVKHANATHVAVSFQKTSELRVIIHDNGKGIDFSAIRSFANGINNMKKRMSDIGGQLEIKNENGTVIILTIDMT